MSGCDRCFIYCLNCDLVEGGDSCSYCALSSDNCTIVSLSQQVPVPDVAIDSALQASIDEALQALVDPALGFDPDLLLPGQPDHPGIDPVPNDDELRALLDPIVQFLAPSTHQSGQQPVAAPVPQDIPQGVGPGPLTLPYRNPTPTGSHPDFPDIVLVEPEDTGFMYERTRRKRCMTCREVDPDSWQYRHCNWAASPGQQHGCTHCTTSGLVCVVEDVALPPHPTAKPRKLATFCSQCRELKTRCDRLTPCLACSGRGLPLLCTYDRKGCFRQGTAYGTELYAYVSALGGGPSGINCPDNERYPTIYEQTPTYHIEYARWLLGGPLPMPPGYSGPIPNIPRPNIRLRVLASPLPVLQAQVYRPPGMSLSSSAIPGTSAPNLGQSLPFQNQQQPFPSQSSPGNIAAPATPVPPAALVRIPPGVSQDEITRLGQGETTIFNLSESLIYSINRTSRPTILYNTNEIEMVTDAHLNYPVGHPERADVSLLVRPQPNHPNSEGRASLLSLPDDSTLAIQNPSHDPCMAWKAGGQCSRPTFANCEGLAHDHGSPLAVCGECNISSRARFEPELTAIARQMRAYACAPCSHLARDPDTFEDKGFRVWGFPGNAFDAHQGGNKSSSMGTPRRLTGCSCADKLLDRHLCTPHRLHHFLEMREKVRSMRRYITAVFGRQACPFCLNRVGIDSYGFRDEQDYPIPDVVYACLSCNGIVVLNPAQHASLG
ncbi:hypothetical protein F5Y03DRAFT_132463 [Xylaria venustula]|nr:hypothetical protein F5Y03DRAFT_132463 [Xylaria venustula]